MDSFDGKRGQLLAALCELSAGGGSCLRVRDAMTAAPRCVGAEARVPELVETLRAHQFRHLLVVDAERRLLGVVSDRDLLRCLGAAERPGADDLSRVRAVDVMSSDAVTVEAGVPLAEAAGTMLDYGINCLPVTHEGRIAGILTASDLILVLQLVLPAIKPSAAPQRATAPGRAGATHAAGASRG